MDDAFSVYEQVIAVEKGKENSTLLPLLYAQYSRFSYLVCHVWSTNTVYSRVLTSFFCFLEEYGFLLFFFSNLFQVYRDAEKAKKIIAEALDHVQPSKPLLEALIHFESIQPPPRQVDYLGPLVEKVIKPNADTQNVASSTEREELSLIYIEVMEIPI